MTCSTCRYATEHRNRHDVWIECANTDSPVGYIHNPTRFECSLWDRRDHPAELPGQLGLFAEDAG